MLNYKQLPDEALLRASEIHRPHGPFPGGRTTWWERVRSGDAPTPIKFGRATVWRWGEVREYLSELGVGNE